jgi:hypothetical protein
MTGKKGLPPPDSMGLDCWCLIQNSGFMNQQPTDNQNTGALPPQQPNNSLTLALWCA